MIGIVEKDRVVQLWSELEHYLDSIMDKMEPGHGREDMLTMIIKGEMHLWTNTDKNVIILTQLLNWPRYKVLYVYSAAGEAMNIWGQEAHQKLVEFAQDNECRYMEFIGRKGWARYAKEHGYEDLFIRMRKKVSNG